MPTIETLTLISKIVLWGQKSYECCIEKFGERIKEISASLPEGIVVNAVYDRTKLVNTTLDTVEMNLTEGAIFGHCCSVLTIRQHKSRIFDSFSYSFRHAYDCNGNDSNTNNSESDELRCTRFWIVSRRGYH